METIKFFHLITSIDLGGAERRVLSLLKSLPKEKYEISLCFFMGKGVLYDDFKKAGVKVFDLRGNYKKNIFPNLLKLISLLRKERPHILHTHLIYASLLGRIAGKILRLPIVTTQHHAFQFKDNTFIYKLERWSRRFSDITIVLSYAIEDYLRKSSHVKKVEVVHTGIDIKEFSAVGKKKDLLLKEFKIFKDDKIVGTVANHRDQKGYEYFFKGMREVVREIPNIKIFSVGEGPLLNHYKEMVKGLGLKDKVIFTGYRKDIFEVINIFDVFVISSLQEGFGRVLIEAMALKKPVVATQVEAIPEIVLAGETGILVPPKDSESLAREVIKLLKDKSLATQFGDKGKMRVEKEFTSEKMIKSVEEIYKELIKEDKE